MKKDYGVVKNLISHTGFCWNETRKIWDGCIELITCLVLERVSGKFLPPGGISAETEEGNSNTEIVRSSEPTNLGAQVVDVTLDSDSTICINDMQPRKCKSVDPSSGSKKISIYNVLQTLENALYEMLSTATFKALKRNAMNEKTMYQKCIEKLQKLEDLDDTEFTKEMTRMQLRS